MGGGYSASGSESISNSSGVKTGPITTGAVTFGTYGDTGKTLLYVAIAGVAALVAWLALKK